VGGRGVSASARRGRPGRVQRCRERPGRGQDRGEGGGAEAGFQATLERSVQARRAVSKRCRSLRKPAVAHRHIGGVQERKLCY
jgi:hypothetical protein